MNVYERAHHPLSDGVDTSESSSLVGTTELDFQYVVEVMRKYKWFLVVFPTLIFGIAVYYVSTVTPTYRSTATLLIEPQKANVVSIEAIYDVDDQNSEYYQTQIELLKSRELASKTIDSLNLWTHHELVGGASVEIAKPSILPNSITSNRLYKTVMAKWSEWSSKSTATVGQYFNLAKIKISTLVLGRPAPVITSNIDQSANDDALVLERPVSGISRGEQLKALRSFSGRVVVEPIRKTKLIRVSYESADTELASKVANEIGAQYIASFLESKQEVTSNASEWLSGRLSELKKTLSESEQKLRAFKRENGLVDVDGRVGRLNERELLLLTTELSNARSQLSSTSDVYRELRRAQQSSSALANIGLIQDDRVISQTNMDLGIAQREKDRLLNRYGEKHPRVVDIQSQIDTLQGFLRQNLNRIVSSKAQELKLLEQRVNSIEAKLASGKKEIQEIGSKKFQLDVLEREVATNQKLYDIFFSRYTESKSANGLRESNARIVESAVPAPAPVRPRKTLISGMAGVGAFVFAVLLSFIMDKLDKTVKGSRDVERRLGLRMLGLLPAVKQKAFGRRNRKLPLSPIGNADRAGKFAEAVNALRTALSIDPRNKDYKVILLTSSVPSEGKTTSSVNLAYSFGQQEKVLLIDGDMRRPTVGETIGLDSDAPGLSDLINMSASPKDCIRQGVLNGSFDLLPAGQLPDHPLELLTNPRFEELIQNLSKYYHRIIIDSAPVNAVSDALVFSQVADAVVYVIKSHATPLNIIKRGLDRLESVNANIVGAVMTQAHLDKLEAYGGAIHYAGFYDAYGYSNDGRRKRTRLKRKSYQDYIDSDDTDHFKDFQYLGEPTVWPKTSSSKNNRSDIPADAIAADV